MVTKVESGGATEHFVLRGAAVKGQQMTQGTHGWPGASRQAHGGGRRGSRAAS